MLNLLEPSGKYVPPGSTLKILQFAYKMYLCVLNGSYNKQDLPPLIVLIKYVPLSKEGTESLHVMWF